MPFWIDNDAAAANVVELTADAITVGSYADTQNLEKLNLKLQSGRALIELLGKDQLKTFPLSKVIGVRSRSIDRKIQIDSVSEAGKTQKHKIRFQNPKAANQAAQEIGSSLPADFHSQTVQANEISASLPAWASFTTAWMLGYTHFNSAPWLVGLVCGIWALISLVWVCLRVAKPPLTRNWRSPHHKSAGGVDAAQTLGTWLVLFAVVALGVYAYPDILRSNKLHSYVAGGGADRSRIVQILDRGVEINARDGTGQTALDWALQFDNHKAATLLLELGADFQKKNPAGYSSVDLAFGDPDDGPVALAMLRYGLDANYVLAEGNGLLATALLNYQEPELIAELLKHGADPRQLVDGQPAFEYVVRYEYSQSYLYPILDAIEVGNQPE